MVDKIFALVLVTLVLPCAALDARIEVHPSTAVEVGEEVVLDATGTTHGDAEMLRRARFEWDFGDGYVLKFGEPIASSANSGIAVVHYFMQPGTHDVTLIVSLYEYGPDNAPIGPPLEVDSATITITVSGQSVPAGFELLHAPFEARIGQYVIASIPSPLAAARFTATLRGPDGFSRVLIDKTVPGARETFLLDQRELPRGDYVLTAELRDGGGAPAGMVREKWHKPFDGLAKVGIDENNAICIEGEPFFPVTPWMTNASELRAWSDSGYINTTYCEGWYETHDSTSWRDYLDRSAEAGLYAIGPTRWEGQGPRHFGRNSDLRNVAGYVSSTQAHPALLLWSWVDEPNMGGRHQKTPPAVLASWTAISHRRDSLRHPVAVNMYGYDYLPYYGSSGTVYDYVNSAEAFGGKKAFFTDVSGFDIYPLEYHEHPSLVDPERGIMDLYAEAIDSLVSRNLGLIPVMSFVEVCDIRADRPSTPPTDAQVLMESWLNVVHGVKGINWFNFFEYNTIRYDAMATFCKRVTRLAPVILSAPSSCTVTDNADTRGNRVDLMVREHGDSLYVFAVRITEPPSEWDEAPEPETIAVTFDLGDAPVAGDASVDGEERSVAVVNGGFTDEFAREAVHIYAIPLGGASTSEPRSPLRARSLGVDVRGGFIRITVPGWGARKAHVSLFDLNGRCLQRCRVRLAGSRASWRPAPCAARCAVVRVRVGTATRTARLVSRPGQTR